MNGVDEDINKLGILRTGARLVMEKDLEVSQGLSTE